MPPATIERVERLAAGVHAALAAAADDARRDVLVNGYAPTALRVYGAPLAVLRKAVSSAARELRGADAAEVVRLAGALVDGGTMEGRLCGYLLLERHRGATAALDRAALERLGRGMDNWALVDTFCCSVAGRAWQHGAIDEAVVHRWARSKDRWWRRAALVSTVPFNQKSRGGRGDAARTLAVCELLVADHDDMVVKAMSWALRSLGQFDRPAVEKFLRRHEAALHRRVLREVRTKLTTGTKSGKRPSAGR